jgi:hypothetical protein
MEAVRAFVGLGVHKATISIAVADDGRGGEVRHVGTIEKRQLRLASSRASWRADTAPLSLSMRLGRAATTSSVGRDGNGVPRLCTIADASQAWRACQK